MSHTSANFVKMIVIDIFWDDVYKITVILFVETKTPAVNENNKLFE